MSDTYHESRCTAACERLMREIVRSLVQRHYRATALGIAHKAERSTATGVVLCVTAVLSVFSPSDARAAGSKPRAEFAVRWNPAEGGPKSAEAAAAALDLTHPQKRNYEIRYFLLANPPRASRDLDPIVRERRSNKEIEVTYKLRGEQPEAKRQNVRPLASRPVRRRGFLPRSSPQARNS